MNVPSLARRAVLANTDADGYTRLVEKRPMDRDKDGMVAKDEFLAMVAKLWDVRAAEGRLKGDRMSADQFKALEVILGRTLSAHAGR